MPSNHIPFFMTQHAPVGAWASFTFGLPGRGVSLNLRRSDTKITSYDALDHSLLRAGGNIYIAFKTWCGCLLLEAFFIKAEDHKHAKQVKKMADLCAQSLVASFDIKSGAFPANLIDGIMSQVIAAIEPLAVPWFCGVQKQLLSYTELMKKIKTHVSTCLKEGFCVDKKTGGLRLSSSSANTWPSKAALCYYVLSDILGLEMEQEYSSVLREILYWTQVSAAEFAVADQINVETREALNGFYYPRVITSAFMIKKFLST